MTVDPNVHPEWAAQTKAIAAHLDQLDYFQVLGAAPEEPIADIKAKYHQLQRNYHPDAFFNSPDVELRNAVLRIAKRVAEAYTILRDPAKRTQYTTDVSGPERAQKLRYSDESDQQMRQERLEEHGKTPQGRQLYRKAIDSMRNGDLAAAERDLQTALIFEPGSELFTRALEELKRKKG
ncbi:MAG: DnaJ domain-containing protein [Myxococcota bacterium]